MSGASSMEACPKCGGQMYTYSDWKPHDTVGGQCTECGFAYWTEKGRVSLEEINELRAEMQQRPLKRRRAWQREK
jgi:uncharacterized protein with PIN domain